VGECTIRVVLLFSQLLTATAAEGGGNKQSLLTGHSDRVQIHQLKAVGLIASSGVCESVVSCHLLLSNPLDYFASHLNKFVIPTLPTAITSYTCMKQGCSSFYSLHRIAIFLYTNL